MQTHSQSTPTHSIEHSQYRVAVGQLLWVNQLRADIAFEVIRSLQCPDEEDQCNLKQLLTNIKGTVHYKVKLEPNVEHSD
eukprot:5203138-Amphidinium_carterae.2